MDQRDRPKSVNNSQQPTISSVPTPQSDTPLHCRYTVITDPKLRMETTSKLSNSPARETHKKLINEPQARGKNPKHGDNDDEIGLSKQKNNNNRGC